MTAPGTPRPPAAAIVALAVALVLGVCVAGPRLQTALSAQAARAWTAPTTAWGDPDLEGVWTSDNNFAIPL